MARTTKRAWEAALQAAHQKIEKQYGELRTAKDRTKEEKAIAVAYRSERDLLQCEVKSLESRERWLMHFIESLGSQIKDELSSLTANLRSNK